MNLRSLFALTLLALAVQTAAMAAPSAVPEIDPASAGGAIALLAGVVLMVRGRRSN